MAVKKIIDIEVNDEAFKRFMDHFKAFEEKVGELPSEWKSIDEAMAKAGKGFAKSMGPTEAIITGMAASSATIVEAIHHAAKAQRQFENATRRSHHAMKGLSSEVHKMTHGLFKMGKSALAISGLGAVGGGWAFDTLAYAALSRQRTARGLGMTPGQTASLGTYFNRYGNAQGVAMNVANIRNDIAKRYLFTTLGIGSSEVNSASNYGLTISTMEHAQKLVKGWSDQSWLTNAQALGITNVINPEMLRVLRNTPISELQSAAASSRQDVGRLGFDAKTAQDWSKFSITLHRAGVVLESGLIKGLDALAPQLSKISHEAANWISAFLGSPEFTKDMKQFAQAIGQLSREAVNALRYFGLIPGGTPWSHTPQTPAKLGTPPHRGLMGFVFPKATKQFWEQHPYGSYNNPGNIRHAYTNIFTGKKMWGVNQYSSDQAGMQAMAKLLMSYPGKHHAATIGSIIPIWNGHEANSGQYAANVAKWSGIGINAHLDLTNPNIRDRVMAAMIRQEHSVKVTPQQVQRTIDGTESIARHVGKVLDAVKRQQHHKTTLVIRNQAGANVALQANGMAH